MICAEPNVIDRSNMANPDGYSVLLETMNGGGESVYHELCVL
jgi:hypothetical protein